MQHRISEREREILGLASQGLTDKAIAAHLGISARTVGTYWERLKAKTFGKSRAHIVMEVLGKELESAAQEAKEAKLERDLLLDQAEEFAVFSIGLDGKILDWNTGVLRLLGYTKEEFVAMEFAELFTPEDARRGEPSYELDSARQHGRYLERRYHTRKDGSHIWISGTLVAIYDGTGQVKRYSKIMRDDSQRKSMEEEIQRLQASH